MFSQELRLVASVGVIDGRLQLIACGSSGTNMPTYLVWDREVLEECYDQVDAVSLHAYYGNTPPLTGSNAGRNRAGKPKFRRAADGRLGAEHGRSRAPL